jgi:CubicO group peptidase (beta-lactamase class C family)
VTVAQLLPRSAPEAQGIASQAVLGFVEAVDREVEHLHSLMLVRRGHVVAEGWWEPYGPALPHMLFSLSKSFTATAVGLAVAEGRLSLDDHVLAFFPDDAPAEVSPHLAAMRVRHLLAMATGHDFDTTPALHGSPDGNWARAFLACPVAHQPGAHFLYNTGATYMLSAIIQRLTGVTLLEYLQPRLLTPLGVEGATWERCPRGVNTGGFGLSAPTEAIANFGQLYLQGGVWQGRQLVPAAWVAEATRAHIANGDDPASDWAQGYGFQFWRCRHGAYRGDGAFGQFCVVLPAQAAVLAITAGLADMQQVLDLVWDRLLPALGPAPLPADPAAHAALAARLAALRLPAPQGQPAPALAAQVSGVTFRCDPNDRGVETVALRVTAEGVELAIADGRGEHVLAAGDGAWRRGATRLMAMSDEAVPVAAAGAWLSADTYQLRAWYVETPFCLTLTCCFADDLLLIDTAVNVSFGPTAFPQLLGRRA